MTNEAQPSTRKGAQGSDPRAVAGPDLGQSLQEQIGQALQPAMAEFREQMAATVVRELDQALDRDGERRQTGARQGSGREMFRVVERPSMTETEAALPAARRSSETARHAA
jgi:hypothetical protein